MIGSLPTALEIDGREYAIHSDFRVILRIYSAFADPELDEREKCYVCLKCLYAEDIPREHLQAEHSPAEHLHRLQTNKPC